MKIGSVTVDESVTEESFIAMIRELDLKPPVVIKPNWGTSVCFTETEILNWVLTAVGIDALVVESYGWARTEDAVKAGRMGSKKRGDLRRSDRWFLEYSGIGKVLEEHGVEFLNVTEENWSHETVDPETIKEIVEAKHSPVEMQELYGFVPERLFDLRGGDLLSLAKVKLWREPIVVSFALKNFFGMLPNPSRWRYYGKKDSRLSQSIIDVYKVYDSLFEIKGVVEAALTASVADPETRKTTIHENPGFAAASKNPMDLDAFVTTLIGRDPGEVGYLKYTSEVVGPWSDEVVQGARSSGITVI